MALSSTQPADLPLPRRAFKLSFGLVALRARCDRKPTARVSRASRARTGDSCTLRRSRSFGARAGRLVKMSAESLTPIHGSAPVGESSGGGKAAVPIGPVTDVARIPHVIVGACRSCGRESRVSVEDVGTSGTGAIDKAAEAVTVVTGLPGRRRDERSDEEHGPPPLSRHVGTRTRGFASRREAGRFTVRISEGAVAARPRAPGAAFHVRAVAGSGRGRRRGTLRWSRSRA